MVFQAPITSSDWFRASAALAVLTLASTLAHAAPVWNVNIGTELTTSDNFAGAAPENTVSSSWNSVTTPAPVNQALVDSTGAASTVTLTLGGGANQMGTNVTTGPEIFHTWLKHNANTLPVAVTFGGLNTGVTYALIVYSDWLFLEGHTVPITQTVGTGLTGTVTLNNPTTILTGLVQDTDPANNSGIQGNWIRINGLTPNGRGNLGFDMNGKNSPISGFQLIQTGEAPPDTAPPTPNPAAFAIAPIAAGTTSITMTAVTASDPSGVEYYFDETTGNPGGTTLSNPLVSGPNAAPLGDGIANLTRYAHGVGLSEPVAHLLPRIVKSGGGFVYRFRHAATKTDIAWQVRASDDLASWPHVIFDSQTDPIPPLIDGWLEVPVPQSLGGGPAPALRMFLRLGIEQLAP